jgi:uncharacterized Zn-binding protein involved in type VI secretion
MSQPAARIGDLTASGDPVASPAPGAPPSKVLISGQPAACLGDLVTGPACTGAIGAPPVPPGTTCSRTVLIGGRNAARVGDLVGGTNPASGAQTTTSIAPPGAVTVLIGG